MASPERLTFLGRNSSDLTAVVIASMLGESACQIDSDVPGIYTADSNLPGAQLIPEIGYPTILRMSRHGAKVLHHRAVHYAETHGVTIVCKSLTSDRAITGTIVTAHGEAHSVTVARDIPMVSCASLGECDKLCALLARYDINTICVEDSHGVSVCVVSDVDFALRLVALADTRSVFTGLKNVVTELEFSVLRVRLVDDYAVPFPWRAKFTKVYPAAASPQFGSRMIGESSAYSSLLIGANDAPGNPR
ncbi:hypothetical protein NKH94_31110 [Mesorhizobium australicum]|uniref:amino acid kinase family protein n=1 Tax=Mesorhizobium australicum TaxID=536018 RepID=UPI00333DEE85